MSSPYKKINKFCKNYAEDLAAYHCEDTDNDCGKLVYSSALQSCLRRYRNTGMLYDDIDIANDLYVNYKSTENTSELDMDDDEDWNHTLYLYGDIGIAGDIYNINKSNKLENKLAKDNNKLNIYCQRFASNVDNYQCSNMIGHNYGYSDYCDMIYRTAFQGCRDSKKIYDS